MQEKVSLPADTKLYLGNKAYLEENGANHFCDDPRQMLACLKELMQ